MPVNDTEPQKPQPVQVWVLKNLVKFDAFRLSRKDLCDYSWRPFWIFSLSCKASRLACQRLREAVSEIKKVAKKDPVLGAEGAVRLMEKLWPALQHEDSSSGALGSP